MAKHEAVYMAMVQCECGHALNWHRTTPTKQRAWFGVTCYGMSCYCTALRPENTPPAYPYNKWFDGEA